MKQKKCMADLGFIMRSNPYVTGDGHGHPIVNIPSTKSPWDRNVFIIFAGNIVSIEILLYRVVGKAGCQWISGRLFVVLPSC